MCEILEVNIVSPAAHSRIQLRPWNLGVGGSTVRANFVSGSFR